ncbi:MAG: hypothetical protein AAF727_11035 [Pseudomonadota bacterium]
MQTLRPVGQSASARKYDIITALGAYALAQGKHDQRRILRLITLITARYNWSRDELSVGQREIARLWSVDERTVKRETATWRAQGWLIVKRQGARGRVTRYGLDIDRMLADTADHWMSVGPDFELRMAQPECSNVVPMPSKTTVAAPDVSSGSEWALAQAVLHAEDPSHYASWIAGLVRAGRAGGCMTLRAPSRFHGAYVQTHFVKRVLTACQEVDPDISEVRIIV